MNNLSSTCTSKFNYFQEIHWNSFKSAKFVQTKFHDHAGLEAQGHGLANKPNFVHDQLHRWDKAVLKRPKRKRRAVQRELENITRQEMSEINLAKQKDFASEIEKLQEQEEVF